MHAFVSAVLLGFAGLDELGLDAERDPPDGEPGEAGDRPGSERVAVVGTDALGETVLPEDPAETTHRSLRIESEHALAGEQEAGVSVLHGEREAELTVTGSELALEVSGPGTVGLWWDG